EETYTYRDLNYGQEYLAGVAALFSSGYSELDTYLFRSQYLYPPDSLQGMSPLGTDYAHLWWLPPSSPTGLGYAMTTAKGPAAYANVEADPMAEPRNVVTNREIWDIHYNFAMDGPSGLTGLAGAESDGEFIYAPRWDGNEIAKFDIDGNFIETFSIPGVSGLRDLAFNGTYMFGGAAGSTVWKMDFTNHTLISSFTAPTAVRAIAYDSDADAFWANNWATDMILFNEAGVQLASLPGMPSMYGAAYDKYSADGPHLWFFTGTTELGGCQVEQYNIANQTMTGVSHSVSGDFGSDLIAGGLYIIENLVQGKVILGGTAQGGGDIAFGYELADYTGGPIVGVPANLLGYNLYRNDAVAAYIESPTTEYFDMNLDPGTYMYDVTAVYDLEPYGYPGQTAESMKEGTVEIDVIYGYELPFMEDWNTGLFTTNQWTTQGANWRIAGQVGNPAPAAEFFYNPAQTDYALSLTSSWINGREGDDNLIDGDIWLDFDLKLEDLNQTGDETLQVEVFNGSAWSTVVTYTAEGNTDWEMEHVKITSQAKNKVFRVRFTAKGTSSLDIYNWMIDNIHIYRQCAPPTELTATEESSPGNLSVILNWTAPGSTGPGVSGWLAWDNGINDNAIGLTGGGTFSVAARFTPTQLAQYAGTSLTKIRMFPYAPGTTIVLKVWTGANASQLVLTQPLASYTSSVWNEIALNTAVPVTGATELWFGYTVTHGDGVFAAGCDEGPAVAGFGDKISLDGSTWDDLSAISDISANWNLQGFVETLDGVSIPLQPISDNTVYEPVSASALTSVSYPALPGASLPLEVSGSRELVGYNVYRDGDMIGSTEETTYTDADQSVLTIGETFCYTVTAVYEDCESPMSEEACILVTDVPVVATAAVSVYPNPSNSMVNIELTNNISQVVVYNYVGQVVFEQTITKAQTIQLNVRNYEAGAYLIKFVTINGENFTKKVVVTN
ncbi:MAG: T9SS type A sorting domain-containing protein, partial [Acholeplasmataceae bacterium]